MPKKRKQIVTNPLTQWLLDYVDDHDVSLTELSVRAGLFAGSLRSLVMGVFFVQPRAPILPHTLHSWRKTSEVLKTSEV